MEWMSNSVAGSGDDVVVVGPPYCAPHVVHLTFSKKTPGVKTGHLAVVDAYGRVMYKIEDHHSWTIRDRMLLLDVSDRPILLVQAQRKTSHAAYDVYRGDSRDAGDFLFSIRKASKAEVHVCLASFPKKHSVDFKIRGDVKKGTIGVYKGESTQMIAEMEQIFSNVPADKKAFGVAVSPNVDSCFIAALFAALPQICHSSAKSASKVSKIRGYKKTSKKSGTYTASEKQGSEKESEESESEDDSEKAATEDDSENTAIEDLAESEASNEELVDAAVEAGTGLMDAAAEAGMGLLELLQSVFEAFLSD